MAKETAASVGAGWNVLVFTETLLLSLWLGSMIFFSFAVAPSAFAVLPSRELAGRIVTSTIGKVEMIGLVIGPLLILIQAAMWRGSDSRKNIKIVKTLLVIVMIAAAALSRFWISPQMVSLRASMGVPIDEVALNDPVRNSFNNLHQYSVALMSTAMLAGLVVLFLTVRSSRSR
jgi:hypothetical protein